MIYLVAALLAVSVGFTIVLVAQLIPARSDAVRRLAELREMSIGSPYDAPQRRRRQAQRERYEALLQTLGEWVETRRTDNNAVRERLMQAGFRSPNTVPVWWGIRLSLPLVLGVAAVLVVPLLGYTAEEVLIGTGGAMVLGWIAPSFYLDHRIRNRQYEIKKVLPDALDLLVVCVEAGLGLNQAIVRMAQEIRHLSVITSEEFSLVNLEIRAGTPREDALRNLAVRTGVEDMRSITTTLIQTERFGTSIGQALRVSSETQRVRRRQEAEEIAAKMPVKMVFPLIMCIFPALMVVLAGPAFLQIFKAFGSAGM